MQRIQPESTKQAGSKHSFIIMTKKPQIFHTVAGSGRAKAVVCMELIPKGHAYGLSFSQISPQLYFAHLSEFHCTNPKWVESRVSLLGLLLPFY